MRIFGIFSSKKSKASARLAEEVELLHSSPLVDPVWYRRTYLDLRDTPIDVARHYLEYGAAEGRNPHPLFDTKFYMEQNPDVVVAGTNPLLHFLRFGAAEGRDPNLVFDSDWYLAQNPDVAAAGINPLEHYVLHGKKEGRLTHPSFGGNGLGQKSNEWVANVQGHASLQIVDKNRSQAQLRSTDWGFEPISVVIPTFNRSEILTKTISACCHHAGGVDLQFVVIDDGSTDRTPDILSELAKELPNFVWRSQPNSGAGKARNYGASLAKFDIILFMGDDIQPLNSDFFATHSRLHKANPSERTAILGKVVWPYDRDVAVSFVMSHIQGRGGEQFGYSDLAPHTIVDWRFFYTCNISVKKSIIQDWQKDGFSAAFNGAGFEDTELAYRLSKQQGGFSIYYDPTSVAQHIHPYTAGEFINRQVSAGMLAQTFIDLHPEVLDVLGLRDLVTALHSPRIGNDELISEYLSVMEGIKSWARIYQAKNVLGREAWHDDFLFSVFELSFYHGFCIAQQNADLNFCEAYSWILSRCIQRLRRTVHHELTSHEFITNRLFDIATK